MDDTTTGAVDLVAVAEAAAAVLGDGWTGGPGTFRGRVSRPDDAVLTHTDGRKIGVDRAWDRHDRIEAWGMFPSGPHGPCRLGRHHRITIRGDRGPAVLAAEIRRRLLPDYDHAFVEVLAEHAHHAQLDAERGQAAKTVLTVLDGARVIPHFSTGGQTTISWYPSWSRTSGHSRAEVTLTNRGETAAIELTGIPRPVAESIYRLLGHAHGAAAESEDQADDRTAGQWPPTSELVTLLFGFEVRSSNDPAQCDHDLICRSCDERICTIEPDDQLYSLVAMAVYHHCPDLP